MIDRRDLLTTASAFALLGPSLAKAQSRAGSSDTDWLHYANDSSSTRYSPLDQINAANFDKLELAWRFSTNALGPRLDADYQSTPLVVKGRIYVTAGFRRDVVCLDAGTGELLWMHTYDEGQRIGSRGGPGLRFGQAGAQQGKSRRGGQQISAIDHGPQPLQTRRRICEL